MSAHGWLRSIGVLLIVIIIVAGIKGIDLYRKAFAPNVFIKGKENHAFLYIPTGSDIVQAMEAINKSVIIRNEKSLEWTVGKKNYKAHVYPGRYRIKNRMSNNELINLLRSGKQEPMDVTFNDLRSLEQLATVISKQLEFKPSELLNLLRSDSIHEIYGFNRNTISCMFIPNTYEFYWNTTAGEFIDRMYKEYEKFWNTRRQHKAETMKLSRMEVITLASIVNEETHKDDEKARIAGLYVNRLNKGFRLQADPTVKYAIGDFNIKRVLKKHYQTESPYNTYRIDGLPPGPICLPSIKSIDAVLNYEVHNYMYMCAKADFSGYHVFAKTLSEHNRNAELYRRQLNLLRIYR